MKTLWVILGVLVMAVSTYAADGQPKKAYDESADATSDIAAAQDRAVAGNKRVLLNIGANWCGWCLKMHDLFTDNAEIAALAKEGYEVVYVDAGHGDKNLDVLAFYSLNIKEYPYFAVLSADGKVLARQETQGFEKGNKYDAAKVAAFLKQWKTSGPTTKP